MKLYPQAEFQQHYHDVILKRHDKKGTQDDMYDVREDVMYMLSFEKFVIENPVDENE